MIDPGETADEANKMNLLQLCGSGWHTLPPEAYHRVPLTSAPSAPGARRARRARLAWLQAVRVCAWQHLEAWLRQATARPPPPPEPAASAAQGPPFCLPLCITYPYRYPAEYVPMDTGGGGGDGTVPTAPNTIWFQSTAKLQAFKGATSHANGM